MIKLLMYFFLVVSSTGLAENLEPILPVPEASYSQGLRDRITGEPLPKGNWAFDLRIENPNDRPIVCLNTKFFAYIDTYRNQCRSRDLGIWLNVANSDSVLTLKENEILTIPSLGFDERIARGGEGNPSRYEFCSREPMNLNCGFYCSNGKKYGDESWKITINEDGYKKQKCSKSGVIEDEEIYCTKDYKPGESWKETVDKIEFTKTCQAGGSIFSQQTAIYCDDKHKSPDTWEEEIPNGKRYYSCLTTGKISTDTRCKLSPPHVADEHNNCIPQPCGGTAHGQRGASRQVLNGSETALCDYGQWTDSRVECNSGFIKENLECRPGNSCSGRPHLDVWWLTGTCNAATKTRSTVKVSCNDGNIVRTMPLESKTTACRPCAGGRTCSDSD